MAMPTAVATPSAHVVGSAFVEQYYHILHASPELVHRFYQDSSVVCRPDANGTMTSATTMQGINDMILSLDYKNFKAEIKSADAQESFKDGVMILVTGCLTGKNFIQRKFAQSFFLAPQDKGYFVFSDVFRYVDENESQQINPVIVNRAAESVASVNLITDPEHMKHPVMEPATSLVEESHDNGEEIVNQSIDNGEETVNLSNNGDGSVVDVEVVAESVAPSSQNETPIIETASSGAQEDAPKKTYASIVKVMKGDRRPIQVYVPTNSARVAAGNVKHSLRSAAPAPGPEASTANSYNADATSGAYSEVESYSIYIRSLPMNATVAQVEEEFKKFGTIKPGGVQVRSNKGHCFGFVEFEALSSMQSAIEASSVTIGSREAFIEQKKTTSRVGSGRGRFPPNRTTTVILTVVNESGRGDGEGERGGGFGRRNDFGNRGEFSGRGRGRGGRGYQQWAGRVGPQG